MNKITCICLGVQNNQKKKKYYSSVGSKGYTIGNKTKLPGQPPLRGSNGLAALMLLRFLSTLPDAFTRPLKISHRKAAIA